MWVKNGVQTIFTAAQVAHTNLRPCRNKIVLRVFCTQLSIMVRLYKSSFATIQQSNLFSHSSSSEYAQVCEIQSFKQFSSISCLWLRSPGIANTSVQPLAITTFMKRLQLTPPRSQLCKLATAFVAKKDRVSHVMPVTLAAIVRHACCIASSALLHCVWIRTEGSTPTYGFSSHYGQECLGSSLLDMDRKNFTNCTSSRHCASCRTDTTGVEFLRICARIGITSELQYEGSNLC